jgi:hypothetical protein
LYVVSGASNFLNVPLGTGNSIAPAGLYGEVFSNSAISFYSSGAGLAGTVVGTIPATTGGGSPVLHIGSNVGVNFFWNGPIAEYIIFNRALTRAELASVEAYLAAKWGISGVHRSASKEIAAVSSPTELAGCALWLDGADSSAASMTLEGSSVSTWKDKSGSGRNVSSSGDSRPTLTPNYYGGLSAVTFDGNDYLQNASIGMPFNGATVFVVFDEAVRVASTGLVSAHPATGDDWNSSSGYLVSLHESANQPSRLYAGVINTISAPSPASSEAAALGKHLVTATIAADSSPNANLRYDGADGTADTLYGGLPSTTSGTLIGTRFLAGAVSTNYGFNGKICEIVAYQSALSAVDRARVEKYLQQKWATPNVPDPTPPVGYWADKSGNSRHLTQSLAASRPLLLTNGISSKPCLNFDGTDDNIWRQPGITSDDLSILIVHQTSSMSGGVTYEFTHQGDTTNSQATNYSGFVNVAGLQVSATGVPTYQSDITRAYANVDIQGRSGSAGDITANVPFIGTQCVSYSATASSVRKQAWANGKGMLNSGRFNCGGWSAISLGCRRNNLTAGGINSPTVFLSGRIAEVIAYSRYISDSDRRKLELYLARKWNVTLAGAPTVSHPEAQDWIDRVYGAGGSVSTLQANAVNTFCIAIDNAGIRDKFYRLNLHSGGTTGSAAGLAACLVPLYLGPTSRGVRFGNTIEANTGPFTSADYSTTDGLYAGLNSGKYLDTGFASSAMPQSVYQAMHLSVWHGNAAYAPTDPCLIGAYNSTIDRADIHLSVRATPTSDDARLGQTPAVYSATQLSGSRYPASYIISRTSPTSLRMYRNGAFESETTTSVTPPGSSLPLFVHRRNNGGTPNGEQIGMSIWAYSIGAGMTAQQVTDYYNAMTAFNTSMGRLFFVTPQVSNADAQSWITRVYNNGGTVSSSTATAVNNFCNAIDAAGIRDRFFRLNLFCGGTSGTSAGLAACLVPLYRGQSVGGTQYGGYIDTNSNFAVGDYAETGASGGLQGNGTNKILDTGLPGNTFATSSRHLSAYEIVNATTDYSPSLKQFTSPSTHWSLGPWTTLDNYVYAGYSGVGGQPIALKQTGHFFGQNTKNTEAEIYRNGSFITTNNTGPAVSSVDSTTITVLGSTGEFSEARLGGYSIGIKMDSTQVLAYYNAMQAFQTALSRNV